MSDDKEKQPEAAFEEKDAELSSEIKHPLNPKANWSHFGHLA